MEHSTHITNEEADMMGKPTMYPSKEAIRTSGALPAVKHPTSSNLQSDNLSPDSICKGIRVTLDNNSMWNEFFRCKTEMILTNQGSRMFPYCRFRISGLHASRKYSLVMDIQPLDNIRYKWTGKSWQVAGKAECLSKSQPFAHPESPSTGQHWMQNPVSFYKLKLTNNMSDQEGNTMLLPMHRYLPRLHVVQTDKAAKDIKLNGPSVVTFTFPQTEFMAVTAYQNSRFAQLKVDYNPFAKGLKEDGSSSWGLKLKLNSRKDLHKDGGTTTNEQHPVKKSLKSLLANHKPRSSKTVDSKPSLSGDLQKNSTTNKDQSAAKVTGECSCSNSRPAQKLFSELIREAHVSLQRCNLEQLGINNSTSRRNEQTSTKATALKSNGQDVPKRDMSQNSSVDPDHQRKPEAPSQVKVKQLKRPAPLPLPALALFLKQHSTKSKKAKSKPDSITESSSLPLDYPTMKSDSLLPDPECSSFGFEPLSPASSPEPLPSLPTSLALELNSTTSEPTPKAVPPEELPHCEDSAAYPAPSFQENEQSLPFPAELSPLALQLPLSPTFSSLDGEGLSPTPSIADLVHFFSTDDDLAMGVEFSNTETVAVPCPPPNILEANAHEPAQQVQPVQANKLSKPKKMSRRRKLSKTDMDQKMDDSTYTSMQPNLEEVEEQLFVSFTSKEALKLHTVDFEGTVSQPQTTPDGHLQQTADAPENAEGLEEKIFAFEQILLRDLKLMRHRQVIHPVLQEVGLKMNLLDPSLAIDLQYLGVRLPIPAPGVSLEPLTQELPPSSPGVSAAFVSRTGKTTDVTQIKGWREKFTPPEAPPTPAPAKPEARPSSDLPKKNLSAFCSDMLDEYLENEGKLIDERAASFSQPLVEPVVYELPTRSTSYVRTLDSILKKQTVSSPTSDLISGFIPPSKRPKLTLKETKTSRRENMKHKGPKHNKLRAEPAAAPVSTPELSPADSNLVPKQPAGPPQSEHTAPVTEPHKSKKHHPKVQFDHTEPSTLSLQPPAFKKRKKLKPKTSSQTLSPSRSTALPPGISEDMAPLESDSELGTAIDQSNETCRKDGGPVMTRALLRQKDLEDGVVWEGRPKTSITEERAAIALTSLFTLKGFASENPTAPIQLVRRRAPPCLNEFCRLGCICSSLSHCSRISHCGRPPCMLGCSCLKQKVVLLKNLDGSDSSPSHHENNKKKKRKRRMKMAYILKEADSVSQPSERVRILWKRGGGDSDPDPIHAPEPASLSRPTQRGQDGSSCARVRVFQIISTHREENNSLFRWRHDDLLCVWKLVQVLCFLSAGEPVQTAPSDRALSPPAEPTPKPSKRLIILAECTWLSDADRNHVLKKLCEAMARDQLDQPFWIRKYLISPVSQTVEESGTDSCIQYKIHISRPNLEREKPAAPVKPPQQGKQMETKQQQQDHLKQVLREAEPLEDWQREVEEEEAERLEDWQREVEEGDIEEEAGSTVHQVDDGRESSRKEMRSKKKKKERVSMALPFLTGISPAGFLSANRKQLGGTDHLVQVNGKLYPLAKIQLGKMGALHPANRLAAYLTGRVGSNRKQQGPSSSSSPSKPPQHQSSGLSPQTISLAPPLPRSQLSVAVLTLPTSPTAERRARRKRFKTVHPLIIMGNVRSLPSKMDELAALTRHQREYRECSIMVFTVTWLTQLIPDTNATLDGFQLLQADRTKKSCVNDRWCNSGHITIKEQLCSKDIELLAVSMRPYYLRREFTIAAYIPPSADAACDILHSVTGRLQTQHPHALLLISEDFNHASPSSTLPTFTQYVTCRTRDNKMLDLFYANTKEAYHPSLPWEDLITTWCTSCLLPKTQHLKDFNSYRPVALTSHLLKTLERLVHLRPLVSPSMDLLHAFNTIQPTLLRDKLERKGVDQHLTAWTLDHLTNQPQFVRTRDCESDMVVCGTGAPQGTVLAPFIFTFYTADFTHNSANCYLQNFSDDSATGNTKNRPRTLWTGTRNRLHINVGKTKEMVVDFHRCKQTPPTPVNIQGMDIKMPAAAKVDQSAASSDQPAGEGPEGAETRVVTVTVYPGPTGGTSQVRVVPAASGSSASTSDSQVSSAVVPPVNPALKGPQLLMVQVPSPRGKLPIPGMAPCPPPPPSTGQRMVLQPILAASGLQYYRRPDGKLVQLVPISQFRSVNPNLSVQKGSPSVLPAASRETPVVTVGNQTPPPTTVTTSCSPSLSGLQSFSVAPLHPPHRPASGFLAQKETCTFKILPSNSSKEPIVVTCPKVPPRPPNKVVTAAGSFTILPPHPPATPKNLFSLKPSTGRGAELGVKTVTVSAVPVGPGGVLVQQKPASPQTNIITIQSPAGTTDRPPPPPPAPTGSDVTPVPPPYPTADRFPAGKSEQRILRKLQHLSSKQRKMEKQERHRAANQVPAAAAGHMTDDDVIIPPSDLWQQTPQTPPTPVSAPPTTTPVQQPQTNSQRVPAPPGVSHNASAVRERPRTIPNILSRSKNPALPSSLLTKTVEELASFQALVPAEVLSLVHSTLPGQPVLALSPLMAGPTVLQTSPTPGVASVTLNFPSLTNQQIHLTSLPRPPTAANLNNLLQLVQPSTTLQQPQQLQQLQQPPQQLQQSLQQLHPPQPPQQLHPPQPPQLHPPQKLQQPHPPQQLQPQQPQPPQQLQQQPQKQTLIQQQQQPPQQQQVQAGQPLPPPLVVSVGSNLSSDQIKDQDQPPSQTDQSSSSSFPPSTQGLSSSLCPDPSAARRVIVGVPLGADRQQGKTKEDTDNESLASLLNEIVFLNQQTVTTAMLPGKPPPEAGQRQEGAVAGGTEEQGHAHSPWLLQLDSDSDDTVVAETEEARLNNHAEMTQGGPQPRLANENTKGGVLAPPPLLQMKVDGAKVADPTSSDGAAAGGGGEGGGGGGGEGGVAWRPMPRLVPLGLRGNPPS
ncbi:MAX dimerization protein MGA a [Enoplosus armatus]|uniref:MAX dimerization protein MGA a n=1 Tax=Enoplosus armatus TaxID=215367 RepID=UPI0039923C49